MDDVIVKSLTLNRREEDSAAGREGRRSLTSQASMVVDVEHAWSISLYDSETYPIRLSTPRPETRYFKLPHNATPNVGFLR